MICPCVAKYVYVVYEARLYGLKLCFDQKAKLHSKDSRFHDYMDSTVLNTCPDFSIQRPFCSSAALNPNVLGVHSK